jgi:hypothetical protein
MPEPNYTNGDPPGFFTLLVGTIVVIVLFVLLKSCMGGA